MSISTTPAIGWLTDSRSASIGAETWAVASRKITTSTTFERISAITKVAHLLTQLRVWSQLDPASAIGAKTIAISSSALRISRLIHTTTAAPMARPARKIVRIAPAPGAAMLMAPSPAARRAIRSPISSMLVPAALTMPMQSWSVISSAVREQGEGDEGAEDRLRQPERGSGQRGWLAADHAADDLEHEEAEHDEDRDAEQDVVDLRVLAAGDVDDTWWCRRPSRRTRTSTRPRRPCPGRASRTAR